MSNNQEFVSFPFRPYLANYLFALCKNEVIETEQAYHKHLDIDLRSPDGFFLRLMCTNKKLPVIQLPSKGFRLTISIPKQARNHTDFVIDSRTKAIWIDEKAAEIIQEHFDARFRSSFIDFVSGAVYGAKQKRGAQKEAILYFMEKYGLNNDNPYYNYDQLVKLYERRNTPLKKPIYDKK